MSEKRSVLSLDGYHYVDCGDHPHHRIARDITMEAWVKAANQRDRNGILHKGTTAFMYQTGYGMSLQSDSSLRFLITLGNGKTSGLSCDKSPLQNGVWHHIAMTYDGNLQVIYLDGIKVKEAVYPASSIDHFAALSLLIGAFNHQGSQYCFSGQLAEIRLWQLARTAEEINRDMHRALTGSEPGLVGLWPLDDGQGAVARDLTSYGSHGKLNGGGWVQDAPPIAPGGWTRPEPFDAAKQLAELGARVDRISDEVAGIKSKREDDEMNLEQRLGEQEQRCTNTQERLAQLESTVAELQRRLAAESRP